jgi:predicted secreted hydrolase
MLSRRGRLSPLAIWMAAVGVLLTVSAACSDPDGGQELRGPQLSLVETLGGLDTAGYARATEPRPFDFPRDHGAHPDFRTEWWYVTGNLEAVDGRAFGFQFTVFRSALSPDAPTGDSEWSTNQAFMGHFALTDVSGGSFRADEVFARGTEYLAGARTDPFEVWLQDWYLRPAATAPGRPDALSSAEDSSATDTAERSIFPLNLRADAEGAVVELTLQAGKPPVAHGVDGLSQKGPEFGNASYYYAHTRMPAAGHVILDGDTVLVEGLAWLDREWSTSALSPGQVGWDWFALQLDDGWDLMVYQLRREDGSADPHSDGALIDPTGLRIPLEWDRDVHVEATSEWRSPYDGTIYPAGWRIQIPDRGWDLTVRPAVADQELLLAYRYWEGAVLVDGRGEGSEAIVGRGYVELTGYEQGRD